MPTAQIVFQLVSSFQSVIIGTNSSCVRNDNGRVCELPRSTHNRRIYSTFKIQIYFYQGCRKVLSPTGRKQATGTEDFDFHISYL